MRIKTPHYYRTFKCIAGACPDSCCAGWEVDVDDESFERYKQVQGSFGERLHAEMSEEGEKHFIIHDKRCPFLNEGNLCDLYIALGEDALCETCTNFPRCIEEYGSLREKALSMACPEVTRLMLESREHIHFDIEDDGKPVTSYNDINAEMYFALNQSRATVYHILKRDEYTVAQKLKLILMFGSELEKCMHKENASKIDKINANYDDESFIAKKLKSINVTVDAAAAKASVIGYLKTIRECECISEKWHIMLDRAINNIDACMEGWDAFDEYMGERKCEFEYFLENLAYRYFLRGVFDGRAVDKSRYLALSYVLIKTLDTALWLEKDKTFDMQDQIFIMQTMSKELEHSDENMALLWENCYSSLDYNDEKLQNIINL